MPLLERLNDLSEFGTCGRIGFTMKFRSRASERRFVRPDKPMVLVRRFCLALRMLRLSSGVMGERLVSKLKSRFSVARWLRDETNATSAIELPSSQRLSRLVKEERAEKLVTPALSARFKERKFGRPAREEASIMALPRIARFVTCFRF